MARFLSIFCKLFWISIFILFSVSISIWDFSIFVLLKVSSFFWFRHFSAFFMAFSIVKSFKSDFPTAFFKEKLPTSVLSSPIKWAELPQSFAISRAKQRIYVPLLTKKLIFAYFTVSRFLSSKITSSIFASKTVTGLFGISTVFPSRAKSLARFPSTWTALKAGGACKISPVKFSTDFCKSLYVGSLVWFMGFPVYSRVSVSVPKAMIASYFLENPVIFPANRVWFPTQTTSKPSAKLSKVPVWPTLVVFSAFFIVNNDEKLVHPGCFAYKTIPDAFEFWFLPIQMLVFTLLIFCFWFFNPRLFLLSKLLNHCKTFFYAGIHYKS